MCNSTTLKLPSTLLLLTLLILLPPQTQSKQSKPCTAGITFLKTFTNTPPNNNNNNPPSKITKYQHKLINTTDSTYTIQITYPCGSTPLQKIEKLKTQVHDPFISFYLISNSNKKGNRFKRLAKDYGSGDYDDDNEDDDEDDDGDDDDDEEDEEGDEDEQVFTHHHHNNEIEDNNNELLIYPSNHVIPNLPTPIVQEYSNDHVMETPVYYYSVQPTTTAMISPTRSISNYVQESTSMGVAYTSTTATTLNGDDEIIFSNPQLGSGDGPVVVSSTPVYNPVEEYSSSTTTTDEFVTTTTGDYYSSSSSATPSLKSHHHLVHPIAKQLIYSGSPHVFEIPENTLSPPCYEYEIVGGSEVADFVEVVNGSTVRVYPSTTDISDYNLRLSCGRGSGSGVVVELFVSVRQRQKSRLYNHEFVVEFGMVRGGGVGGSRVGVVFLVSEFIQRVVGGDNGFVLLSTELESYPFRVSFVNESIISNVCPVEELKRIYSKLVGVVGSGGQGLMDGGVSLQEDSVIKVERVELRIPPDNNQCGVDTVGKVTGGSGGSGSGSSVYGENYPPTIKNQIDRINGSVGEYLVYPVREDFCYDPEDGGTRGLDVRLKSNELVEIGEEFWLQFDRKNQEFFGLPMGVENREFVLVCSDKSGKSANDVLELQITPPRTPPTEYYTEFSFHFQSIPFTPKNIRKFITKLSTLLSPHIQVSSYSESNSHVLFRYFNTTNPSTEGEVTSIRKVLISDDGPVSKSLVEWFGPEFNVSVVSIVPLRGLLSENNPVGEVEVGEGGGGFGLEREDLGSSKGGGGGGGRYFDFDKDEEVVGGGGSKLDIDHHQNIVNVDNYSGYLTTYIIPSVLIAVMILLALIIACLLSRKNKYTQASTTEGDGVNSRVYLKNAKKGVPVIFQDELDEKLFNNRGELVDGKGSQNQQRGNIYEPPPPSSILQQSNANQSSTNTTPQNPTPSRLTSPTPSNPRYPSNNPTGSTTPLPPDYQNSISRSMMRNRPHHQHHHHPPPPGAIQVFPTTTATPPQHHHHHHPHDYYTSNRSTPPPIFQQQQPPNYQIDAYQPPPGISYYGIHNSNSGGSGFSERTTASGILQPSSQVGSTTPTHVQQQQQPYHHHHHIHQGSNKMAPPPYVPP